MSSVAAAATADYRRNITIFFRRRMGTGLPFLLEITLLVIGLPLAFAWLLALAGLAALPMRGLLKKLRSAIHPRSTPSSER